jgi:hypothetical protein
MKVVSQWRHVRLGVKAGALLADKSVLHSHIGEILDGHGTVILSYNEDGLSKHVVHTAEQARWHSQQRGMSDLWQEILYCLHLLDVA